MQRLLGFSLGESKNVMALRQQVAKSACDKLAQIKLGIFLAQSGCTYEAAHLLRPHRAEWKSTKDAGTAKAALAAQSWWNKNWRDFAHLKQANDSEKALALLGDRAVDYWDLPPLLMHLGQFAADDNQLALAAHLFRRVYDLSLAGLPKMNMAAFEYVAQAGLIDVLSRDGKVNQALDLHEALRPNPGNAMAYELQHASLLVAANRQEEAMERAAKILMTAHQHRNGYSKTMRLDFIENSSDIAPLRHRKDWQVMLDDPKAWCQTG